ncbi:hypothetical protein [Rhodopirellula sp. SWK7]|uniref:hypothetical protein n=1 Tax=Rhodopirellula sp. SWK7 TaxID=595460 RepID=UPI0002BEFE0D|nr:hypothetical protein [Rhodopirellula sp. SWK7]EMI42158.1 hypothetical protein RRSWK_05315 [Rhodopirellula sp. SWK7]
MIAPIKERPYPARQHAIALEEDEQRPVRVLSRLIEKQPAAALTVALAFGLTVGWLVKRKNW